MMNRPTRFWAFAFFFAACCPALFSQRVSYFEDLETVADKGFFKSYIKDYWKGFWNDADRKTMRYDILGFKPQTGQWKWNKERGERAVENYRIYEKQYADKMPIEDYWIKTGRKLEFVRRNENGKGKNSGVEHWIAPTNGILRNTNMTDLFASKSTPEINELFDFPKNMEVIKTLIKATECNEDIILDFFAVSKVGRKTSHK